MNCGCDYDSPEFYNQKQIVAKLKHSCSECGIEIEVGEEYENVFGKWNGQTSTYKTCHDCLDLRFALETTKCYCLVHGCLVEDFSNAIQECWKFSYSVKDMKHKRKFVRGYIVDAYEEWKECRDE